MSVSKHQKLQELLGILTRVCESRRGMTTVLDSDENSFVVDCALPESMCMMLGPGASTAETESRIRANFGGFESGDSQVSIGGRVWRH
jgi:hypothetical protein